MSCSWSAAILAGGRARRLGGGAKPLLEVGGVPIVERQLAMFAALGVVPRLVAVEAAPLAHLGLEMVPDIVDGGALGGLYTALETAVDRGGGGGGRRHAVPDRALRRRAAGAIWTSHDAARAADRRAGWHPLAAVYRRRVAPRLRDRLDRGERRVVDAVTDLDVAVLDDTVLAPLDPDGTLLCNVNTPADVRPRPASRRGGRGPAE